MLIRILEVRFLCPSVLELHSHAFPVKSPCVLNPHSISCVDTFSGHGSIPVQFLSISISFLYISTISHPSSPKSNIRPFKFCLIFISDVFPPRPAGSNPFYEITGHVRAYPTPPTPPHEYVPDPPPNLSHVYPPQTLLSTTPLDSSDNSNLPTSEANDADPDLTIRWTTFSVFHGEERWRSEGVQIGGLKSARGILGNWFDKDYDAHGPAGPTGFWKLDDGVERFGRGAGRASGWDEEGSDGSD